MSATSDFLVNVFKIERMREWRMAHPEQWAQFSEWAKTGVGDNSNLNDEQRKWLKQLKRTGAGTDNDPLERWHNSPKGFVEIKDFPAAADLTDAEWKDLYLACQSTFMRLKANRTSYDSAVQDFITDNDHFFDNVTDESLEANADTDTAILNFLTQLETLGAADLYNLFGIQRRELMELLNPLREVPPKKPYNNKKEVREKIQELVRKVVPLDGNANKSDLERVGLNAAFIRANNLEDIINDYYGWHMPAVSPTKLTDFKDHYPDFFAKMVREDKDATKVYEAFKSCESENKVVSESIEKAKKDIDYNDPNSKNFVPKKMDTKLTVVEQIQKWAGDTYSDYFKKYEELRGARIYQHASEVKDILKQIDKAKIKTTDTLSKLVENADAITKKLQGSNPPAAEAFEWLATSLKEFDANPSMSSVMKKALESGSKMNDLVSELIMRAAEDGKPETVKKAEIAMEILATMKYGNTTSKVMDAIKEDKTLFEIFSNEKLSWNKNAGMKFVTAAVDKTIRAACLGFGRGAAFLVNRFRRHGTRFNGRFRSSKMRQAHENWAAEHATNLANAQAAHDADTASAPIGAAPDTRSEYKKSLDDNTAKRANAIRGLRRLVGAGVADDDAYVEAQQERLDSTGRNEERRARMRMQPYEDLISSLRRAIRLRHQIDELNARMGGAITPEQVDMENKLRDEIGVLDLSIVPGQPAAYDVTNAAMATEADMNARIAAIQGDRRYNVYQGLYERVVNRNYEKQQHIDDYRKATQEIRMAEERIEARQKKLDALNKNDVDGNPYDIYKHLMAYWDTLQNPTLTRFGLRRASKIQAQNSNLVGDLFQQRLGTYNLR